MSWFTVYYTKDLSRVAEEQNITEEQAMHRRMAIIPSKYTRNPAISPEEFEMLWVTKPLFECYAAAHLDQVFVELQGENWNRDGRYNQKLIEGGYDHSSMSMGDIIHDVTNNKWFVCAMIGFAQIPCPLHPRFIEEGHCQVCGENKWSTDFGEGRECVSCHTKKPE